MFMASPKKNQKIRKSSSSSELRRDLVTGEWVLIAKGRAKRPHPQNKEVKELKTDKDSCPFEDPQASGNAPPVLMYKNKKDWSLQIIPNKYPALTHFDGCGDIVQKGEYLVREGRGYHEVIITRDHDKHIALLSNREATEIVRAYHERYKVLKEDKCIRYISIFHNHGKGAGASLAHPHSQLLATPVLPVSIQRSLRGSNLYFRRNGECVHCVMIDWEKQKKERVIFENEDFIVFCPFVSRVAFEVRIFPKKHEAYFEKTLQRQLAKFAEALRVSLRAMYEELDDPDYNFFLHTAPVDNRSYPHYHWHLEIRPKLPGALPAGFELGTGIETSPVEPKKAAKYLRKSIE